MQPNRLPHLLAVILLVLLAATSASAADDWTVLVYMNGDCYFEGEGIDDINEMEMVGSSDEVNIVVQFDRIPGEDTSNGDWTTTRRYYITSDSNPLVINSPMLIDLGEANMGSPVVLQSFIEWGISTYPAAHYLVILWDHFGSGWRAPTPEPTKGICFDTTSSYDSLTTAELRQVFANVKTTIGRNLDIVAADACLMQMAEVAYDIRASADYYVASEANIPLDGFPYNDFLAPLTAAPTTTPAALCQSLVDTYIASYSGGSQGSRSVTLSALDLSQMSTVATKLSALGTALTNAMSSYCLDIVVCQSGVQVFGVDGFDLYHAAECLLEDIPDAALQTACADVMLALDSAIIAEGHYGSYLVTNSHGLSIYWPDPAFYSPVYNTLLLATDTQWDDFLQTTRPCTTDGDPYEPDDNYSEASTIDTGETQQHHWFCDYGDIDWARFTAEAGATYYLGTKNLASWCDSYLTLYDTDHATILGSNDDAEPGNLASFLSWTCPASDTYYITVNAVSPEYAGILTMHDLFLKRQWFSDVNWENWAFEHIDACYNAEIVGGYYPGGPYMPTAPVDRAQMAVFISRAVAGGDSAVPDGPTEPTFSDVATGTWAYKYVEYAVEQNIVTGYPDGYYQPTWQVNRGLMAVFVARALVVPNGDAGLTAGPPESTFPDVTSTGDWSWCYDHVEYIAAEGITQGYYDGLYHPEYTCSRDQMAVYIQRAFNLPM
jgi:hypothetical protein